MAATLRVAAAGNFVPFSELVSTSSPAPSLASDGKIKESNIFPIVVTDDRYVVDARCLLLPSATGNVGLRALESRELLGVGRLRTITQTRRCRGQLPRGFTAIE